jgi:transcriptional regulator with XRE-family HTH domain
LARTKSWRTVRGQRELNEQRVDAYKRLMDAETRLADLRARRGMSQSAIADALDVSQPNVSRIEREDDLYLSTLARYVVALGGYLEVRAVFDDETVTLLRLPPDTPSRDDREGSLPGTA